MSMEEGDEDDKGDGGNFIVFRDCLATAVIERLAPSSASSSSSLRPKSSGNGSTKKRRGRGRKGATWTTGGLQTSLSSTRAHDQIDGSNDMAEDAAAELSEFTEYLAEEIFPHLPPPIRTLSYAAVQNDVVLREQYALPLEMSLAESLVEPLPVSVADSLCSYGLMDDPSDLDRYLGPVVEAYIASVTTAPAEYTPSARPDGCEICQRTQLPLTYHHLIPRAVHEKAVKRGWHREWELNKVAWLCRACHSFVHRVASNEELAREGHEVDLLLAREDVRRWAQWVGRVRWKAR